ncbi:MAG: CCA tRNA nucleotidyltransferase [Nanopusillaceae archaeon]
MFEEILDKIKPKKEEKETVYAIINEFIQILESEGLEIFLGGSFAKDTWLSGDYDVDIFVLFSEEKQNMSDLIENVLVKRKFNYNRIHGSRDYFKVFYKGVNFELVPILKINNVEEAKNVTDLSPFHVDYILKKIKGTNLNDEIRLLKSFMKSRDLYGAESYIRGFSGYVCELLIIYYKNFYNLIKSAILWQPKVFIDIENYYKNLEEAIRILGKDKTKSPLILIDPTNFKRNAASALSTKKFSEFIYYSNLFLNDIRRNNNLESYFLKKGEIKLQEYINKARTYKNTLLYLEIEGKGNNIDIKNSKALKVLKSIIKKLKENNFSILGKKIFFNNNQVIAIFYIFPKELPEYELKKGPYVWDHKNFEEFVKKHENEEFFIEEDGRISVITKRKYPSVDLLLRDIEKNYLSNLDKIYYKIY